MIDIMVDRQIPDEKERKEEAIWISQKLAEKILFQRDLFLNPIDFAETLVEPIIHVLQFLQVVF